MLAISGAGDWGWSKMIQYGLQLTVQGEYDEVAKSGLDIDVDKTGSFDPFFQSIGKPMFESFVGVDHFVPSFTDQEASAIGTEFLDTRQFWPDISEFILPDSLYDLDKVEVTDSEDSLIDWKPVINNPSEKSLKCNGIDNSQPRQSLDANVSMNKMVECKQNPSLMSYDQISEYFLMPEKLAAKVMNVGLTGLKARCRVLGIPKWPYRSIKSMDTLILYKQQKMVGSDGVASRKEIRQLIEEKMVMEKIPGTKLTKGVLKVRQASYKAKFNERRKKGQGKVQQRSRKGRPKSDPSSTLCLQP